MDDIHRKRLEWMAKAKPGDLFPEHLFRRPGDPEVNGWGGAVSETCQVALDELDRLEKIIRLDKLLNNEREP